MSNNRNINYSRLAALLKALGHEHRLRIFVRLTQCCPPGTRCDIEGRFAPCVGQLGQDIGIAASTLSHHMKELRHAGLIKMERSGQKMQCWVEPDVFEELKEIIAQLGI